jgi:hypothetical protein
MKLAILTLSTIAAFAMGLVGCSSSDGEIEVTSASTPLSEKGGDQLFTIKLVDAAVDGYALETLVVKITPEGKSELKPTCTPNDANGNKKLEKNETVTCVENSTNELDASIAGKPVKVVLFAKIDGEEKEIGEATWTAK